MEKSYYFKRKELDDGYPFALKANTDTEPSEIFSNIGELIS